MSEDDQAYRDIKNTFRKMQAEGFKPSIPLTVTLALFIILIFVSARTETGRLLLGLLITGGNGS